MATTGRQVRRNRLRGITQAVLVGAAVFAVATLTGALLSGATPAREEDAPATELAASTQEVSSSSTDRMLSQSLVYSGAGALAVSVVGLVIVGRRRRLW